LFNFPKIFDNFLNFTAFLISFLIKIYIKLKATLGLAITSAIVITIISFLGKNPVIAITSLDGM